MSEAEPQLYHYQEIGASWLTDGQFRLLCDEAGLGKSAQAITATDILELGNILVVSPATVCENWRREFDKFSLRYRERDLFADDHRAVVVSYDFLTRNLGRFTNQKWDVLILDESHYCKNPETARTRAIFGKGGVVRNADRIWCLSGTPAPNNAAELWVLLYTFGQTKLGYEAFIEEYCDTVQVHTHRRQIVGTKPHKIFEVRAMLAPIMLRRMKREVLPQLPDITISDIFVEANTDNFPADMREKLERERAALLEKLGLFGIEDTKSERELLAILEGTAQSVSSLRRYNGIQKAQACGLMLSQELADQLYDKLIIFAIHHDVIELLSRHFEGCAVLTGGMTASHKQKEIDRFQNDPKCKVFIGNIIAAGTGITLTAAHQVVFVEADWVPGNNAQAMMRAHRIGQLKNVTVRFVSIANSIDEKITRILQRKSRELALLLNPEIQ